MNIHYGKTYDYHFRCFKCGLEIDTSVRVVKDLDDFARLVNRIHPRRCPSALTEAERGNVDYAGNQTAEQRTDSE